MPSYVLEVSLIRILDRVLNVGGEVTEGDDFYITFLGAPYGVSKSLNFCFLLSPTLHTPLCGKQ